MIVDLERRWRRQAACVGEGVDLFFIDHTAHALDRPSSRIQQEWDKAKEVCARCPVMRECARDYLGETDGVWGGLDPAQRHRLRGRHGVKVRELVGPKKIEYAQLAYELHEQGHAWQDVGRLIGLSREVAQYLHAFYLKYLKEGAEPQEDPRPHRGFEQRITEGQIQSFIALRKGGLTLGQIATRTGVSAYSVRHHIKQRAPELLARRAKRGTQDLPDIKTISDAATGASELLDAG